MIKVITFDLDGVYFVNGKKNFIKGLGDLGVSEDEAVRVFLKSDKMNKEYKTGKINDQEYWRWAIGEWDINESVDEIINLMIEGYEINNEVVEMIRKVRSQGIKTCICSNNFSARIEGLQRRFRFLDDFDVKVFSYEVGKTKPAKEIFEKLILESGVGPEEIVMTDDNEKNIISAKELGIKAFYYDSFEKWLDILNGLGVKV